MSLQLELSVGVGQAPSGAKTEVMGKGPGCTAWLRSLELL